MTGKLLIAVLLVAIGVSGVLITVNKVKNTLKVPEHLLAEDFQTSTDRDLLAPLQLIEQNSVVSCLDNSVIKPLLDDVTTMKYTVDGVEITDDQFSASPELATIIND